MNTHVGKITFVVVGSLTLWVVTRLLQSIATREPDRSGMVQVPLLLMMLGILQLVRVIRRRRRWLPLILFISQLGLYVLYETGISRQTNIRADLVFIYLLILFTAWNAFGPVTVDAGKRS